ncbi:AEC family transporter [Lederbergia galactosidilytica]|uniref:Permease n=1 Tax=Lederbergia galactosidilytica TaxID=217031 RepID=A0A177ZIC2_9BACI|nr:AEC family transporter [Lederbergia galactosidilytica]KRG15992.1 permease [Virgibacillus soli]MBP1915621.1 putative permease [Lederbergia galactosidilytica]OAK67696.1 permease [Lederbergia galactosidilytica]
MLSNLSIIFTEIILPVFILILIGVILQRKFKLDLYTLAKINIYYLSPALIFIKLYESVFSPAIFFGVIFFCLLFVFLLYVLSSLVAKFSKMEKAKKLTFTNSVVFYNSANYGIPVNDLVFKHDPFAMSIQVIVVAFQNTFLFSYGVVSLKSMTMGKWRAILDYFKMPLFYAMTLGILLNIFHVSLPEFLLTPISYISNALIAIALLTLGAQIAHIRVSFAYLPLYLSMFFRLLMGPAIALAGLWLAGVDGIVAQALLISTAMPTSVNSSIIAQEYNNEPEFAAQTVIGSTLLSSFTLTIVIYIALSIF